ncbi:glycosyltransferase family 4 protein [Gryllotalpicola ginsengisoli]|uniref:glycosyltransferase family 4 protein n=1 Tax=Gryllotalpicola ginsengisoli TaxID=444608 RepID=UPI0003B32C07|nr:glycosyltransferase family 4 protein [Gryllotalpicola ginsengisoli]
MTIVDTPARMPDEPQPGLAADGRPALKIAMIAPPWFELPPRGYGGTEAVVAALVDGLVARGHEVTLIGAGEHRTAATRFHQVYPAPPTERLGTPMPEVIAAAEAARALEGLEIDLVHDHTLAGPLLARGRTQPTVVTMHGPVTGEGGDYHERLGRTVDIVAISDAQRRLNPRLNWVGTVHNAIEVSTFPFREQKDDYVLWLGRFSPDKGPDLAIEAARAAGRRIVLAGKLNEPEERRYFDEVVRPLLGPGAEYVGEADAALKRELLSGARALAFPIQWEEPFGMVMIEAMACGTPVVALRRGSVPEIVEHSVSGFVVDDFRNFPRALELSDELDPAAARRHAEARFDVPVMAEGYERVYRMLVEGTSSIRRLTDDGAHDAAGASVS